MATNQNNSSGEHLNASEPEPITQIQPNALQTETPKHQKSGKIDPKIGKRLSQSRLSTRPGDEKYLTNQKKNIIRGSFAVVGCLLIDMSIGEFNLLSSLYPYFASYFHMNDPSITQDDMKYLSVFWLIFQSLMLPVAVYLYSFLGFKQSFLLYTAIFSASQFVASLIDNYWTFMPVYAVSAGIAQGGYVLPLYCCWRYFPAKYKARVSGVILSAYALAPIPSSALALWLVNPDNQPEIKTPEGYFFGPEVARNVPRFLKIFSLGVFTVSFVGMLMILEPLPMTYEEEVRLEEVERARKAKGGRGGGRALFRCLLVSMGTLRTPT